MAATMDIPVCLLYWNVTVSAIGYFIGIAKLYAGKGSIGYVIFMVFAMLLGVCLCFLSDGKRKIIYVFTSLEKEIREMYL